MNEKGPVAEAPVSTTAHGLPSPGRLYGLALLGTLLIGAMLGVLGQWAAGRVEQVIIRQTSTITAHYLDSFISPLVAQLLQGGDDSEARASALDAFLKDNPVGKDIVTLKIWDRNGRILHSNRKWLVGRVFPVTTELERAWNGEVQGEFDRLEAEENESERPIGFPVLEIYSPVHEGDTEKIIAVAEFYLRADSLKHDIERIGVSIWWIIGVLFVVVAAAFLGLAALARKRG